MRIFPAALMAAALTVLAAPNVSSQTAEIELAKQYLATLDKGDFHNAYSNFLAPSFQAQMTLQNFAMSYQNTKQQLGVNIGQQTFRNSAGRSERQVVLQNTVPTPNGPALQVRFRTIYPNTVAFEDVYMQPTPFGTKVVGTWIAPGF